MKTVLLTGASSGIGLATARQLCLKGFELYGIGRIFDNSIEYPENFHAFSCDMTEETALEQTIQTIRTEMGTPAPDILIHNAGVGYYGLAETISAKQLRTLTRTNLEVPMVLTSYFLPFMKQRKSGHIIFISSVTAKKSNTYGCAYGATKAGLLSFANSLFEEVRKLNIKVTTLLPDMTMTQLYRNADFSADTTACLYPKDIAEAISELLLCSEHLNVTELTIQPQKHRIQKK